MLHNVHEATRRLSRDSRLGPPVHGLLFRFFYSDACCLPTEAGGTIVTKLTNQVDQIISSFDDLTDLFTQWTSLILFAKLDS